MGNQPQRAPDGSDFLDGIDEQFQQQMKLSNTRKQNTNGSSNPRPVDDPVMTEIFTHLQGFSIRDKELVLSYIRSLKQKVE